MSRFKLTDEDEVVLLRKKKIEIVSEDPPKDDAKESLPSIKGFGQKKSRLDSTVHKWLEEIDHVRKISGMYMDDKSKEPRDCYIYDEKKNKIILPQRLAPETQVEIFKDLANEMPEYEWFIAQEHALTKDEYHKHLAESRIVFSANLQETLGISMYEGALVGTYPLVPNRLSYKEMFLMGNVYPSEWTLSWESYQLNKTELVARIRRMMGTNSYLEDTIRGKLALPGLFFDGKKLYETIKEIID